MNFPRTFFPAPQRLVFFLAGFGCCLFLAHTAWPLRATATKQSPHTAAKGAKPPNQGDVARYQALLEVQSPYTLLCVAAHPDDEDGASLVYYRMKFGVNTASVTATHGEGGQNAVSPELDEALGVIRTREMKAAAEFQESPNYNLGLKDFGFSKSSREAFERWGHQAALRRLVLLIRTVRPEVVITHHDTKTGHGHHQAVGILIEEAFDAAADPQKFPEQLTGGVTPWQIRRLYQRVFVQGAAADVSYDVNQSDAYRQTSYVRIALDALRMHATQGPWPDRNFTQPVIVRYRLVKSKDSGPLPAKAGDLFAGMADPKQPDAMPATTQMLARVFPSASPAERWKTLQTLTDSAEMEKEKRKLLDDLQAGIRWARLQALNSKDQAWIYNRMVDRLSHAIVNLSDLQVQIAAAPDTVVPGEVVLLSVTVTNNGNWPVNVRHIILKLPEKWGSSGDYAGEKSDYQLKPGLSSDYAFRITPAADAHSTLPAVAHLYDLDFQVPQIEALVTLAEGSVRFPATGLGRIELSDPITVEGLPEKLPVVFKDTDSVTKDIAVVVKRHTARIKEGKLILRGTGGVTPVPPQIDIRFNGNAAKAEAQFSVTLARTLSAADAGLELIWKTTSEVKVQSSKLKVEEKDGGQRTADSGQTPKTENPVGKMRVAPISAVVPEKLRVGYVRSFENTLPQSLTLLGVASRALKESDWEAGALKANFDTVVLDNRAYLAFSELASHQPQLMEFVEQGGHLIVFYHKPDEFKSDWAAFRLKIGDRRVAEENAPVKILLPRHPLLQWPNAITDADFADWVQERGLYFPSEWDAAYQPLLSTADSGEEELRGGYLVAERGKGSYVYTSLVWYRQLRALNPGAFRLFANMIAYPLRPNKE